MQQSCGERSREEQDAIKSFFVSAPLPRSAPPAEEQEQICSMSCGMIRRIDIDVKTFEFDT